MSQPATYRPDIDGLRAIAILGVLFYHAGLGFPGGYTGVDIFFVISGFLITSILLKDLRNGSFSLLGFWERRARRILPALFVVVLAIFVAGWFLLLPIEYEVFGKQVIALVALSSNIKFWFESGYFDSAADEKPLLHTWSLSVEEQFYLLIPLLLWGLFRIRRSTLVLPVIAFGALTSFGFSVYGSYVAPSATFYLLPTRAWELAVGSLLVFALPIAWRPLRAGAAFLGLAAILTPFFVYFPGIRFPGLAAVPPVAGTALLIWSGLRSPHHGALPLPNRLLASRPLVWVGLLSYSLYLWHWPLFAFQKYCDFGPSFPVQLGLVVVAFMFAWLSLRFVERPFRSRQFISSRHMVFGSSAIALVCLLAAATALWVSNGAEDRLSPEVRRYAQAADDRAYIHELTTADIPDHLVQLGVKGGIPCVFVWGDSHAMSILAAVDAVCIEADISGVAATASATAPVLGWYKDDNQGLQHEAPTFNQAVIESIRNLQKKGLTSVILAARWERYLEDEAEKKSFTEALISTVRVLRDYGMTVTIIRQVPGFDFSPPKALALSALRGFDPSVFVTNCAVHRSRTAGQTALFEHIDGFGVNYIDPTDYFEDSSGFIRPSDLGGVLYRDATHLSTYGSQRLKPAFRALLFNL